MIEVTMNIPLKILQKETTRPINMITDLHHRLEEAEYLLADEEKKKGNSKNVHMTPRWLEEVCMTRSKC